MTPVEILTKAAGRLMLRDDYGDRPELQHKAEGFQQLAIITDLYGDPAVQLDDARRTLGIETHPMIRR